MRTSLAAERCAPATTAVRADVALNGWVHRRRDHGGLIFIDLRDRDGLTQIVFDPELAETFALAESLRSEDVVRVHGAVRLAPGGQSENAEARDRARPRSPSTTLDDPGRAR